MLLQASRLFNPEAQVYRFNSDGAIGDSYMKKLGVRGKLYVYIRPRFHYVGLLMLFNSSAS